MPNDTIETPENITDVINSTIAKFEKGAFEQETKTESEPQTDDAKEPVPEPVRADATKEEAKEEVKEEDQKVVLKAKQLAAMARKEEELRVEKTRLEGLQKQLDGSTASIEDFKKLLLKDPAKALELAGTKDFASIASQLWFKELGDDAPAEFKKQLHDKSTAARIEALEKRLQAKEEEQTKATDKIYQDIWVHSLDRDLKTLVQNIPEDLRYLNAIAEDDPEEAYEALATATANLIQAGQTPTAREAAEAYNKQLEAELNRFSKLLTPTKSETKPKSGSTKATTITTQDKEKPDKKNNDESALLSDLEYQQRGMRALKKHWEENP